MLVVVASRSDSAAQALVEGWPGEARVLTPDDLSVGGWRHVPGAADNTAVIGGRRVPTREIDGVLTRLPAVLETDLGSIAAGDRTYVAAEMTAWLVAWMSDLRCPVLNRPSPIQLTGPAWSREQWLLAARELGVRSVVAHRSTRANGGDTRHPASPSCGVIMTVVAGRPIGAGGDALAEAATALAQMAGVELLRVGFTSDDEHARFADADYHVDLEHPEVRAAILARLAEAAAP